eukprot:3940085-Rhodomonas_salina.1
MTMMRRPTGEIGAHADGARWWMVRNPAATTPYKQTRPQTHKHAAHRHPHWHKYLTQQHLATPSPDTRPNHHKRKHHEHIRPRHCAHTPYTDNTLQPDTNTQQNHICADATQTPEAERKGIVGTT